MNIHSAVELFSGGELNAQQKTRPRGTGGRQLQRSRRQLAVMMAAPAATLSSAEATQREDF
jgi:hypothetical protein